MARSISGVVTLEDQPFSTRVVAVSANDNPVVLNTTTSGEDGTYFMNVTPYTGEVMVYAVQDYGAAWVAGQALVVGDVIHPTSPNGYVFRVTVAGNTGSSEPTWPAQLTTINDGDVTYEGVRLLQPRINGYLTTELDSPSLPPVALFTGGNDGAWYDPSDKTSLFTDLAMTTPVENVDDVVAVMLDKSGNGNHATQSIPERRPVYKETDNGLGFLLFNEGFNGTSKISDGDFLACGNNIAPNSPYVADVVARSISPSSSISFTGVIIGNNLNDGGRPSSTIGFQGSNQIALTRGFGEFVGRYAAPTDTNVQKRRYLAEFGQSSGRVVSGGNEYTANLSSGSGSGVISIGDSSANSNSQSTQFELYQCIMYSPVYSGAVEPEIDSYMNFIVDI